MEHKIEPITVDRIYVSPLKAKLVEKDGWQKMMPVDKTIPPTGSIIMDIVADILAHTSRSRLQDIALEMGVDWVELSGALHILTQQEVPEFIFEYRMRQAKELVSCTDLSFNEIARRCGQTWGSNLSRWFRLTEDMSPTAYRAAHRPKDYALRYEWD